MPDPAAQPERWTLVICRRSGQLPWECGLSACENGCDDHEVYVTAASSLDALQGDYERLQSMVRDLGTVLQQAGLETDGQTWYTPGETGQEVGLFPRAVDWLLARLTLTELPNAQHRADALRGVAEELANEAARAATEPRRFHENEDHRQQALGQRIAAVRVALSAPSTGGDDA